MQPSIMNTCEKCEAYDGSGECLLTRCLLCDPEPELEITGNEPKFKCTICGYESDIDYNDCPVSLSEGDN